MTTKSFLKQNECLRSGENLISPNGYYRLAMQHDANLVVYRGNDPKNQTGVLWASGTTDPGGNHFLKMQADGNLVLYYGTVESPNESYWATATNGKAPAYVALRDDGNL